MRIRDARQALDEHAAAPHSGSVNLRVAALALSLLPACGGSVLYETSTPAGAVFDAVADPELHERCRSSAARAQERGRAIHGLECWCETACPTMGPISGYEGRCVPLAEAPPAGAIAAACPNHVAEALRAQLGCEIPDWPLYRCDLDRL